MVEQRRDQAAAEGVVGAIEQVGEGVGTCPQVGAEGELGQHGRAGDVHIGAGSGQTRFGSGNVRSASEQFAGHAAADGRPLQAGDRFLAGGQRLHRVAEQGRQGDPAVLPLLFQQRQLALLRGHQAALLGQLQARGGTAALARFDQALQILGIAQVQAGDAQLFCQGQPLQVTVGHGTDQGQLNGLAVETAGLQAAQGLRAGRPQAAPEVDLVAGAELYIERDAGRFAAADIKLVVAIAVQQALAAAVQAQLQLRQQRRAGNHRAGLGLAHPRGGGGQVVGIVQGTLHQAVQLAAGERVPPLERRRWCRG